MLRAIEMRAVQIYLDNGGTIQPVPFGLSGIHESNFICNSRHFGFMAWVRRYGRAALPFEAIEYLEAGRLTVVQCQAPVVWVTLDRAKPDGLGTVAISTTIRIAEAAVRRSLSLLERHELIDSYRVSRHVRYRAIGERAPNWKTFMQLNSRREARSQALRHAGI
jgi:hypothetical protein